MKTKTLSKRLWGILCLILLCPLSLMAETDYTHYTHVPGNNIDLNPGTNPTTSHTGGCRYEDNNDNVGNIKNGRSSTYHINVTRTGSFTMQMGISKYDGGEMKVTITDEATSQIEVEQTFTIPASSNYAMQEFVLSSPLTQGYKTMKLEYANTTTGYVMNYKNLTLAYNYPVIASWDFTDSTNGYEQVAGTASPFLSYYAGAYAYGNKDMFTLSTGGNKGHGLNTAQLNLKESTSIDLEIRQGWATNDGNDITDGSKHCIFYEIMVPTLGYDEVKLTAMVSHNKPNHKMYAVYSIDGGATWQGTTSINLNSNQDGYSPLSIDLPSGKGNVKVRLLPDGDWYYYLKSCKLTGEPCSSYTVTTNSAGWASFSAPQNVTLSDGAQAYVCSAVSDETVTLNKITNIPAAEGVFIKGEPNTEYTATVVPASDVVTTNLIEGCMTDVTLTGTEGAYILAVKKGVAGLYFVNSALSVPAGKAYLKSGSGSQAKSLSFVFADDSLTGITTTEATTTTHRPRKVMVNNRLVINSNNESYSISGIQIR